ncbi:hypothetical protein [Nocardioides sp.]|uniref:hypothetical protein n=1 Tax=Nocardioides sp. TaxID=35761 RepID=UPI00351803C1
MDARLTRMLDRFGRGRVRRDPDTGTLHHTGPDGVVRDHHVSAWEVGSLLQTLTMIRPQVATRSLRDDAWAVECLIDHLDRAVERGEPGLGADLLHREVETALLDEMVALEARRAS